MKSSTKKFNEALSDLHTAQLEETLKTISEAKAVVDAGSQITPALQEGNPSSDFQRLIELEEKRKEKTHRQAADRDKVLKIYQLSLMAREAAEKRQAEKRQAEKQSTPGAEQASASSSEAKQQNSSLLSEQQAESKFFLESEGAMEKMLYCCFAVLNPKNSSDILKNNQELQSAIAKADEVMADLPDSLSATDWRFLAMAALAATTLIATTLFLAHTLPGIFALSSLAVPSVIAGGFATNERFRTRKNVCSFFAAAETASKLASETLTAPHLLQQAI